MMKKVLLLMVFLLWVCDDVVQAQAIKERRIYYLDCSQSMSGLAKGAKDIWKPVMDNLIEAIKAVPESDSTQLVLVCFANDTRHHDGLNGIEVIANHSGKLNIIKYIKSIAKPNSATPTKTYHIDPIRDFKNYRYEAGVITYVFLMTDGDDDEHDNGFEREISEWPYDNVFAFYVMLDTTHKKGSREKVIRNTKHFWSIITANVNVCIVRPVSVSVFDCRNGNRPFVDLKFDGNIDDLAFDIHGTDKLKVASFEIIKNDALRISLDVVSDYDLLPETFEENIKIKLTDVDEEGVLKKNNTYYILTDEQIRIKCLCELGTNISFTNFIHDNWRHNQSIVPFNIEGWFQNPEKTLGTVKYYDSSFFYDDSTIVVCNKFSFVFNENARKRHSSAVFRFVVDDRLNNDQIKINDKSPDDLVLNVDETKDIDLNFWISPNVPEGTYNVSLQILENNDVKYINEKNIPVNKVLHIWTIKHKKIFNPFWVWFFKILIIVLLTAFIIWLVFRLHSFWSPHFPNNWRLSFMGRRGNMLCDNIVIDGFVMDDRLIIVEDNGSTINIDLLSEYHFDKIVLSHFNEPYNREVDSAWNGKTLFVNCDFAVYPIEKIIVKPINSRKIRCVVYENENVEKMEIIIGINEEAKQQRMTRECEISNFGDARLYSFMYLPQMPE